MRLVTRILLCGAVFVAAVLYLNSRSVQVNPSRKSRFIQAYDAAHGLETFGRVRNSSSGEESASGRHGVWNSRNATLHIAVDAERVPAMLAAMQLNVRNTLSSSGLRLMGFNTPGPDTDIAELAYRSRYEDANTTGVIKIGPASRETSGTDSHDVFVVPIAIEEQWVPK